MSEIHKSEAANSKSLELASRERLFFPADIKKLPIFCGDDRPADNGNYIHIFGGVANITYTMMVLREANGLGPVYPLDVEIASTVKFLKAEGIDAGVHSDDKAEHNGSTIDVSHEDGEVGCGYLKLRQGISQLIAERGQEIIDILVAQDPDIYSSEFALLQAKKVIEAHASLVGKDIFPNSRKIVTAALGAGAPHNIVSGDHVATFGIINKRPNLSLDTTAALAYGRPAYDHDTWAAIEAYSAIKDKGDYQFDEIDFEIANDVDAVATILALGVTDIVVRR